MACHVLNRCISRSLDNQVPEELWSRIKPTVDYFRVFDCIGYVHVPSQLRTKLDDKSHKCVLLGVGTESKAYQLFDALLKKVVISRDVAFDEDGKWNWSEKELEERDLIVGNEIKVNDTLVVEENANSPLIDQTNGNTSTSDASNSQLPTEQGTVSNNNDVSSDSNNLDSADTNETETQATENQIGPSTRVRKSPTWMED
ncbi:putative RNA-directed DNA polymerase [Helianthus annuus]|nr:putative RNA-directed DNA polymerase [Helianthus annuus]